MNRVCLACVTLLVACLPLGASAAQHHRKATVPQILTWISQHLNQTVDWDDDAGVHHTYQYSLEFSGCKVTLTQIMDRSASFVYGPFNLKDVVPNQIEASEPASSNGRYFLSLGFLHLVPRRVAGSPESRPQADHESFEVIYFLTQDDANRQARAWHDAVRACGGKSVPDNLY